MRSVSLMTWDLFKKEFNISAKKGQRVSIVRTDSTHLSVGSDFIVPFGKSKIFILQAR